MENKTIKTKKYKKDKVINFESHFGWDAFSFKENGNSVIINFQRDYPKSTIKPLKRLYKQYKYINRPIPLLGFINLIIGIVLFILFYTIKNIGDYKYIFLASGFLFSSISLFEIFIFLILLTQRNKLNNYIFDNGDELTGKKKSYPYVMNLVQANENSNKLRKFITKK